MNRKIRNGLRKQKAAVQKDHEKVWDILKNTDPPLRKLKVEWSIEAWQDAVDCGKYGSWKK